MIYLNKKHLEKIGKDWQRLVEVIDSVIRAVMDKDFAQPIKPYLRYKDMKNRIIAMPAYTGDNINMAGIKWIASFPDNIQNNLPRAHSVSILNQADTGKPAAIINTSEISAIRTAAVSAWVLTKLMSLEKKSNIKVGIIGFGPIGKMHAEMVYNILGVDLESIEVYDLKGASLEGVDNKIVNKIHVHQNGWSDLYDISDIVITCTVASQPYIDRTPKAGTWHLNVSLRDYMTSSMQGIKTMIVDDWDEVCRENTDIENMHKMGLQKEDTMSMFEFSQLKELGRNETVMFHPMGMAVFDIGIGSWYYNESLTRGIGDQLDE